GERRDPAAGGEPPLLSLRALRTRALARSSRRGRSRRADRISAGEQAPAVLAAVAGRSGCHIRSALHAAFGIYRAARGSAGRRGRTRVREGSAAGRRALSRPPNPSAPRPRSRADGLRGAKADREPVRAVPRAAPRSAQVPRPVRAPPHSMQPPPAVRARDWRAAIRPPPRVSLS